MKKIAQKQARTKKPRGPGAIETVTVDVIEETAPGEPSLNSRRRRYVKKTRAQSNLRKRLRNQKNDRKACRNFLAAQKESRGIGISLV